MIELAEKAITFTATQSAPQTTELNKVLRREMNTQDFEFLKEH